MTKNIAIDLDGTLIKNDLTYSGVCKLINQNPLNALRICLWYSIGGRAYCKRKIAQACPIDPAKLTYNEPLLAYIKKQKGANLVLATGADFSYAKAVADYLKIFNYVLASNSTINMTGKNKAKGLLAYFKTSDFVYAGNEAVDLKVWAVCSAAITVNLAPIYRSRLPVCKITHSFDF